MTRHPTAPRRADGRFRNLDPDRRAPATDRRVTWDFFFNKPKDTVPAAPVPVRALTRAELDAAPDRSLYRLGHSTLLLKLRGGWWITDPVFAERAVALLKSLPREEGNPYVFISVDVKGNGLSNMTMLDLLKNDMGYAGKATVHGFRSSFKTWAAVETNYPHEVSEMALAHYPSDKTVSAYLRTDLLEKRKPLMDDWAAWIGGKA